MMIDEETYEVARVEFHLIKPVRLWWGLLGKAPGSRRQPPRKPATDGLLGAYRTQDLCLRPGLVQLFSPPATNPMGKVPSVAGGAGRKLSCEVS